MIRTLLVALFLFPFLGFTQNRNSVWVFGDSAGIDFRNVNNPQPINSGMDGRGSCVTFSDTNGNLQVYAATLGYLNTDWNTRAFNYQNSFISGSDSMMGDSWYNEIVLLPRPNYLNQYYLFSVGSWNTNLGFYYSLIDMNLNFGLGSLVLQNIRLNSNPMGDCLTSIKHGNGRDWWIISKQGNQTSITNKFYVWLVTADSIFNPIIQTFNDASDIEFQKIVWHPSYLKFMLINVRGYMSEFSFDRCNGTISLIRNIYPEQTSNYDRVFWEGAYSPNGDVFYVSRNSYGGGFGIYNYLLQYDLTAANIPASCDTLDSTMYPPVDCGAVRLAPDGKIYYSQAYISSTWLSYPYTDTMRNYINENLGVINDPDVVGSGCDFQPFSFYLGGKRTYYGLPNNPDYDLGPLTGSSCDTLEVNINELKVQDVKMFVNYNSEWHTAFIYARNFSGKKYSLTFYDVSGKKVYCEEGEMSNDIFSKNINCAALAKGVYLINLSTESETVNQKFMIN